MSRTAPRRTVVFEPPLLPDLDLPEETEERNRTANVTFGKHQPIRMYDKRCGGRRRGSGSRKRVIRSVKGSVREAREAERSQKKETERQQVAGGSESG